MQIEDRIRASIDNCRQRLRIIDDAVKQEIKKPLFQRRRDLLTFLYKEREVYAFALAQLERVLGGDQCGGKYFR